MVSFAKIFSLSLVPLAAAAPHAGAQGGADVVARQAGEVARAVPGDNLYAKDAPADALAARAEITNVTQLVDAVRDLLNEIISDLGSDVIKILTGQVSDPSTLLGDVLSQVATLVEQLVDDVNSIDLSHLSQRADASSLQPVTDLANQFQAAAAQQHGVVGSLLGEVAHILFELVGALVKIVAYLPQDVINLVLLLVHILAPLLHALL